MLKEVTFSYLNKYFFVWSTYDPSCKTEVYSYALIRDKKLILIDPIEPSADCEEELLKAGPPALIILTNSNHERANTYWKNKYNLPLGASASSVKDLSLMPEVILEDLKQIHTLKPIYLPGGAPGETALYHETSKTMIVGDALINLEETSFDILPAKYCSDQQELIQSLKKLLAFPFETLLMAHGAPLTENPMGKLNKILSS
ncbi:MAG: MBL fold metallo-hydrolase [Verrucomicrobiota bacterium]